MSKSCNQSGATMQPPIEDLGRQQAAMVEQALHSASTKQELQRVMCLWLKISFSLSSKEIGHAIGWRATSVRRVQARFASEGIQSLFSKPKGGRRRENISVTREMHILEKFRRQAQRGGILDVEEIRKAYELSVGRTVSQSTVYRLISRYGLRRFLPRPRQAQARIA
jgi:transposase